MTLKQLNEEYLDRKKQFLDLYRRLTKALTYVSILRLMSAVISIYFFVLNVKTGSPLLILIAILFIILFFTLVSFHKNRADKKILMNELIKINEEEIDALNKEFSSFPDGKEFIDSDHPWSYDLDLFGKKSLFQYINRTATHTGAEKLSGYLSNPVIDKDKIKARQEINLELSGKINLRQHFSAYARLMKKDKDEFTEVISWVEDPVFIKNYHWTKIMAYVMSLVTLAVIIAGIYIPEFFKLLIPVVITNLLLLGPFVNRINRYQSIISKKHHFLETYNELQKVVANEDFKHPELQNIRAECEEGIKAIRQLSSMLNLFDQRLNILVGFVLNALFLFDFHMLHRISDWKTHHMTSLRRWIDNLNDIDASFSLAGFRYNHPSYTYPIIDPDHQGITAINFGHPMIIESKRVNNSITVKEEKVILITGANMAGKSTFLRSIGVNMSLAYAGCPVCAEKFITGSYRLFSSMRTSDSLAEDESYFYAEIKRLKRIVDRMSEGEKLIILLDEVLKGTNTTDKQRGSRGLIEKSIRHDVVCFIATHDLSLGNMENEFPEKISNYCFESYIEELDLVFDYRIRRGIAKNMNASFLMKKMGIMD